MIVVRFLFVLLLGFILGVGATLYLIHSGAGDLVIRRTEAVQDRPPHFRAPAGSEENASGGRRHRTP